MNLFNSETYFIKHEKVMNNGSDYFTINVGFKFVINLQYFK